MARPSELSLRNALHGDIVLSDIIVNGTPLTEHLRRHEKASLDYVSPLGWVEGAFERLTMQSPPDLPGERTAILVCPECAGLGCGAVSARIRRDGDDVVWSELGIANDLGIDDGSPWLFEKVTSFRFRWDAYAQVLLAGRTPAD